MSHLVGILSEFYCDKNIFILFPENIRGESVKFSSLTKIFDFTLIFLLRIRAIRAKN